MGRGPEAARQRPGLLRCAADLGITAFDTAPLYDFGDSERALGALLRSPGCPGVRIITKTGLRWSPDARGPLHFEARDADGRLRQVRRDSRPETVIRDVEDSLRRLGVDTLDLVLVHFRDTQTPIAETMGALAALRREGKLRAIGVSNFSLAEVQEAHSALRDVPLTAVQIRLNVLQRAPLEPGGIVPWCAANGVAVLAYSPLAEGRLARPSDNRALEGVQRPVKRALGRLGRLAEEAATVPAALALGWLLSRSGVTSVVAGAGSAAQLHELVSAVRNPPPAPLLERLEREFARVRLHDPWEGSRWRRGLRKGRSLLRGVLKP